MSGHWCGGAVDLCAHCAASPLPEGDLYIEELERRVEERTRERDNATEMCDELEDEIGRMKQSAYFSEFAERIKAAEQRAERLAEAVADAYISFPDTEWADAYGHLAREALAGSGAAQHDRESDSA